MLNQRNRTSAISAKLPFPAGSALPTGFRSVVRFLANTFFVFVLLVSAQHTATAQFHTEKGIMLGAKIGASSYNGDVDFVRPGQNRFDMTYEGELFYRFGRWFSLGVKQSVGKYPELASTANRRTSTALAIRSYLISSRFAPYIQVGASRSTGGAEPGFGFALATGFELEVSRYLSIYQDISFDQVLPDVALDGVTGGRNFDMFGRLGGGIRVRFGRSERPFRLSGIDQPDSLLMNEEGEFRAVYSGGGEGVSVKWDLPGGVVSTDNPLVYAWPNPGRYEVHLTVDSGKDQKSDVMFVDVYRPVVVDTVALAEERAKAVHMEQVVGTQQLVVGEEGSFGMQIQKGAVWPIQYDWDMGDGSVQVGAYIVHRYEAPGTYRVTARASNEFGQDSRELTVDVKAAPQKKVVAEAPVVTPTPSAELRGKADVLAQPEADKPVDETLAAAVQGSGIPKEEADSPKQTENAVSPQQMASEAQSQQASQQVREPEVQHVAPVEAEPKPAQTTVADAAITESNPVKAAAATEQQTEAVTPIDPPMPPPNQIQFDAGGYSWAVETASTASEAARMAERFKFVGFPYGYKKDSSTGRYNVLVGQFASEQVAERLSRRIQPHASRKIWLVKL